MCIIYLFVNCFTYLINVSNFSWIVISSASWNLNELFNNICAKLIMAFRRTTMRVALQHAIARNTRQLIVNSSILSTIKTISMNWVNTKKYNKDNTRTVYMLYSVLALLEHHSMGRHIPATVNIKKLSESICIFINSRNALNKISYSCEIEKMSSINRKCDRTFLQILLFIYGWI